MQLDSPAEAQGASGSLFTQVSTGLPVGVLLSADNGQSATNEPS